MADKVIKQVHPQGLVLPSLPGRIKELRVAAYARVSTSSDEQMGSVAAQKGGTTSINSIDECWNGYNAVAVLNID